MGAEIFKRDDRDVQFILKEHLHIEKLLKLGAYRDFSMEVIDMILDQARKISANVIAPTLQESDREGCRFENGKVYAPKSFHECWRIFKEGSWFGLAMKQDYGGQGVPLVVSEAAKEFFMTANFAFICYSMMGPGNGQMIENFGSPELKSLFLEKMYNGTWCGSMCLTESAVGSDAHMVSTKAIPDKKHYLIQGTKIFITSGEHDLTENIIHLVIARIEGAPAGAKGVSLFAVPKIWVNEDGTMGENNDVACIGIEHKMGMNASSTCVLNFGENGRCRGRLVGEPGMGLAYMFQMVNNARMAVGLESVAFSANIYAHALAYAKDRVQGTLFGKRGDRVRIIEHADVRRMLMNLKSVTEGMRALVYKTYFLEDLARVSPDPEKRKWAKGRVELFTPLVKAYCSDRVFEMGREGIQILGGYGFTKEYPIEQYTRDCKIFSIWDGTNFIQSADLVGRKLRMEGGAIFRNWVDEVSTFMQDHRQGPFAEEIELLAEALRTILAIEKKYAAFSKEGKVDLVALTSTRFLDCVAEVAISHLLLEQALVAQAGLEGSPHEQDVLFYKGKIHTVRYYIKNFLSQVFGRARIIEMEDCSAVAMDEESF